MTKQEFTDKIKKIKKLSSKPYSKDTVSYESIWGLAHEIEKDLNALIKEAQGEGWQWAWEEQNERIISGLAVHDPIIKDKVDRKVKTFDDWYKQQGK